MCRPNDFVFSEIKIDYRELESESVYRIERFKVRRSSVRALNPVSFLFHPNRLIHTITSTNNAFGARQQKSTYIAVSA